MVLTALSILKSNWKLIAAVVVIGGVYLYHNHLTSTIERQRGDIATLENVRDVLEQNVQTLERTITANNESIRALAAGAEQTQKDFDQLNRSVKQSSERLSRQLGGILTEPKPQTCDASIQYLIDAAKGFKQ